MERTGTAEKEEIDRLKAQTTDTKRKLERSLDVLRYQVKTAQNDLGKDIPRLEKLKLQKQLTAMSKELKQGEQTLFMDSIQLDMKRDQNIQEFIATSQLTADAQRQFVIRVIGN